MSVVQLLDGTRVLDLTGEAGVFATRILADLGADVVRLEPPDGDRVRRRPPFALDKPGLESSLHHLHYNRNKRSIVLDLARIDQRETFLRLASTADIVMETAAPGAMDALGFGYEALSLSNPALIYTTITPFGQSGPFRSYNGNDLIGAASSGFLYLNGFPEDPPNLPGGEQAYKMASLAAAAATLVALYGRNRDPAHAGCRIDVSVQEAACMATCQTANANIYTWHGRIPRRMGNVSGVHQCADGGWVSFVLRTGNQDTWDDFVGWLQDEGIEPSLGGEEWRDPAYRIEQRRVVATTIAELCRRHDRSFIFHEGQKRKQLVMPVNSAADLHADEELASRDFFISMAHPELGLDLLDTGFGCKFPGAPTHPSRRAPLLGEHTEEVLRELPSEHHQPTKRGDPSPHALKPLAGLRVADFSWMIAGPAASRVLADLGAEVIKIESQYRIDNIRIVGVQPPGIESIDTNGVFNDFNTNKLSLELNVNHPKGLPLVKELIKRSDIVLSNYTADRMPRWGLGFEDLKLLKPDVISLSMPVAGSTGPYKNYGSYGNGIVAFSGMNMITGFADRPPVGLGPLYSDFSIPYFVVIALLAALHRRDRTGEGQFIDFSQMEAAACLLGPNFLEYTANGRLPARIGNRSLDYAPHGVYRCAGDDRWCAIAAEDDGAWRALCAAIGRPEMAEDPRFAINQARKDNEEALDAEIMAWTRDRDAWQVMHLLQDRGVMAAVVEDLEDMCVRDPWLSGQHLVPLEQEKAGVVFRTHQEPMTIDGQRPALRRAPVFGEHTAHVLETVLGLSASEIEELVVDGVLY